MKTNKLLESSYLARYFLLNAVNLTDYESFPARSIENSAPTFQFTASAGQEDFLSSLDRCVPSAGSTRGTNSLDPASGTLSRFLDVNGTTAFLVIRNDTILLERYYHGYDHASICTSFSTVKSFVSALVGIALHEKLIGALDDRITRYLPELTAGHWNEVTIRHLVSMSSGLSYNPRGFFPWDDEPRVYYSTDLRRLARQAHRAEAPGLHFHYNNYNLLLLGMILERLTGGSVCAYLQEKIWKPLGMEFPATWSLDSSRSGMEKMESGLNACAIDYARFGRLYLRKGDWNGKQVVPEDWVIESTRAAADAKWTNYKYLWWLVRSGKNRFMAVGNLGQFIYVAPDKDCIILRFGEGKPRNWQKVYVQLFNSIVETL
jgi:CubicO group peptidase (beta-lactamase class C family)